MRMPLSHTLSTPALGARAFRPAMARYCAPSYRYVPLIDSLVSSFPPTDREDQG